MYLDTGTVIATTIALATSSVTMILFWRENSHLQKQNRFLRNQIRRLQK